MSKQEVNVSKVPPGFRFHPTEEELLYYYLRKKIAYEAIDLDVIREIDLNKLEPWHIKEKCRIGSTPQNDWYFFSRKDKKYPIGTRTNRSTPAGFWKATGRDKVIHSSLRRIGMRKTLVFYEGRAPHGQKSDWIIHEYRLDDHNTNITTQEYSYGSNLCHLSQEDDGWVVCRMFKKTNHHKAVESPQRSSSTPSIDSLSQMQSLNKDGSVHDQLLAYINGRSRKQETDSLANHEHLDNWVDVDRFVAFQLDGQPGSSKHYDDICFPLDHDAQEPPHLSSMANPNEVASTSQIDPFYH
ncbi:hypothetical protein L1987_02847 [Smallanthus sonchifolius]|uniref:Uncharacterized protein n=1 Tax=Smallanthus sonchifolius TaxID=185202 RepID=A0ACB9K906_9ASTR|nr:hypothetical protein L1987_02847 [Smallanthus sonchifolius]